MTTKLHIICDSRGVPLGLTTSQGQRHDSVFFEIVAEQGRRRGRGRKLRPVKAISADNAYQIKRINRWCRNRRIERVIPSNKRQRHYMNRRPGPNPTFDKEKYRRRNVVERLIGWLKENRRIAMRFEKLAQNFRAMATLAVIRRLLPLLPMRAA